MRLKKFNEMFDPMGSWDPKHPDNQIEKETTEETSSPEMSNEDFKNPEYIKSLPANPEKLIKALDEGLEPDTMMHLLLRVCFRDDLKESFKILMDRMKDINIDRKQKLQLYKWSAEYGRIDFLKEFEKLGWFKEFDENDWKNLLEWLELSRQMKNRPDDKIRTKQYLQVLKYEPNDFYKPNK